MAEVEAAAAVVAEARRFPGQRNRERAGAEAVGAQWPHGIIWKLHFGAKPFEPMYLSLISCSELRASEPL